MHKESTRARIVDAAIELFWKTSYHATNMNDLSREAGVNKATVYQYFDTKEQIAVAAVARAAERTLEHVFEGAFEAKRDPLERLREIYARIARWHVQIHEQGGPSRGCPFVNIGVELATSTETVRDAVLAAFARFRPYYKRIVADLRADGRLRAVGKDDALARDLQDNMNATLVDAKLERSPARIKAGGERAVRYLTN